VVDKIDQVKTKRSGFYDDVPVDPVVITKAVEIVPTVPEAEA
jgi:peptidyl-prolyl cis-trans isomerase B (cyclophilin B)